MRLFISIVLALTLCMSPLGRASAQDYESLFQDFRASGLTREDKRFLQAALAFEGHYNGLLDGDWGRLSQTALERFSWSEFGRASEEWHMAFLALSFFQLYDRDGWQIEFFEPLGLSMLVPSEAISFDPATKTFVNFRHNRSTVAFSTGVHRVQTAQNVHDFTLDLHELAEEPYSVRRRNFAVSRSEKRDGSVLYTRSNFFDGSWSTVMLSADRSDVPILNAIAASISVGRSPPLTFTIGGRIDVALTQTLDILGKANEKPAPATSKPGPSQAPRVSGTGTGFFISEQGHVLTNEHVVEGCLNLTVGGQDAEMLAVSADFDLALLKVDNAIPDGVAVFSPSPTKLNSDVTVVGYPLTQLLGGLNVTRGAVSSQMGFRGDATQMQITAPVQSGNSGGPLLGSDGEVVGVVVGKLDAEVVAEDYGDTPQNVNFAIRGEIAKLFLAQNGVDPILGTSDEALMPEDLAEKAKLFTVFIECAR